MVGVSAGPLARQPTCTTLSRLRRQLRSFNRRSRRSLTDGRGVCRAFGKAANLHYPQSLKHRRKQSPRNATHSTPLIPSKNTPHLQALPGLLMRVLLSQQFSNGCLSFFSFVRWLYPIARPTIASRQISPISSVAHPALFAPAPLLRPWPGVCCISVL